MDTLTYVNVVHRPKELGLTCPEDLFDWEMFQEDPRPFFKFARNLYFPLGCGDSTQRVRPSDSHKLLALLEQKKMLLRVYSQNIDGLEQVAGVSPKKMVYAHGSLQWATCCRCKHKVTAKEIEPSILERSVPLCQEPIQGRRNGSPNSSVSVSGRRATSPPQLQPSRGRKRPRHLSDEFEPKQEEGKPMTCNGVLKPGVTFFGEALNDTVRRSLESDRNKVDALIVIGTSLSVYVLCDYVKFIRWSCWTCCILYMLIQVCFFLHNFSAPISKVIGYLPGNIPRILINRAIVHPPKSNVEASDDNDSDDDEERDFRDDYVFDAYLLGYCDDVTRLLAKNLFSTDTRDGEGDKPEEKQTFCQLLSTVRERNSSKVELDGAASENGENDDDADDEQSVEPEMFKAEDWAFCKVPEERVVLFHGAEPSRGSGYGYDGEEDANSEVTFREVAQCDGCSKRIEGIIQKCVDCFDYDLCQKCYPKISKTHYNGEHVFAAEPAAVVDA